MNAIPCERGDLPDVPVIYRRGHLHEQRQDQRRLPPGAATGDARQGRRRLQAHRRLAAARHAADDRLWRRSGPFHSLTPASFRPGGDGRYGRAWAHAPLAEAGAEVIVAELGDGILGDYGVAPILADHELMALGAAMVMCANDPVAAWGAKQVMAQRLDSPSTW